MTELIINFFSSFSPETATVLMSLTPFGELRLSLPVALLLYNMSLAKAFYLSVLGNMVPPTIILLFASRFHQWIEKKSGFWARRWIKYLATVQKKFSGKYQRYGLLALALFVGVPLPVTGAWSGAVAAFIFGLPPKKAWPFIFIGVIISGVITSCVALGVGKLF